jgi:hypothetical protein
MPKNQCFLVTELYANYLRSLTGLTPEARQANEQMIADWPGWCQGFAVCHAAMHATGQGEWWDAVIGALSESKFPFPDTISVNGKVYKTKYLFDLVFSNVRVSHGVAKLDDSAISAMSQDEHLEAGSSHPLRFEIVVPDPDNPGRYKINTIGSQARIGGYFSFPLLKSVLVNNKELFKKNICLLKQPYLKQLIRPMHSAQHPYILQRLVVTVI